MTSPAAPLTDRELPPRVSDLVTSIVEEYPAHRGFLERALVHLAADEIDTLDRYLQFCIESGNDIDHLTECYLTIVGDTLREQVYFRKHGEYRHSTYAEVADAVYHDPEYMSLYMYGLALTSFLWPNHLDMARLFVETVPRDRGGRYLEIGPGHGYYMMKAMELGSFDSYLGIDISATSVEQTRAVLDHFSPSATAAYAVQQLDFFEATELEAESFDAVVMGEVLEHVERPDVFLARLAELVTPDGYVFVTTCVNAPAIDHIYLWRTTDELEQMIGAAGLSIETARRLPYEGMTLEETAAAALPINVAYVLSRSN